MEKKIINEITETIIDNLYEQSEYYMYEMDEYTESNNNFIEDQEKYILKVIKELNKRVRDVVQYYSMYSIN